MKYDKCTNCGRRAGWISVAGNILLASFKAVVGYISGSKALMADAVHSGTDVVGSVITMLGLRVTNKEPDEKHPYGHGKVEFVTSAMVYVILTVAGLGIFFSALGDIIEGVTHTPRIIALLAAAFSVLYCELIARYMFCVGRELESPSITALGWEQRFDSLSSVAVFIGVLLAKLGFRFMDPVAAMFVGVLIVKNCLENLSNATSGLLDAALSDEKTERIRKLTLEVKGVSDLGYVVTRRIGQKIEVEMEILVEGQLTIEQADEIRKKVVAHLKESMESIETAHCHISRREGRREKKESPVGRVVSMLQAFNR
jgi:cation diffusion facilitator family transporter